MACVALSDIQSAFACVANMAPAFLVVLLGAVDVAAAAAALTSTFLLCFTVTTDVTDCVMRPARPPLVTIHLSVTGGEVTSTLLLRRSRGTD